jgi:hypothetical protein
MSAGESFRSFPFLPSIFTANMYFSIKLLHTIHGSFNFSAHRHNPKPLPPPPPPPQSEQAATESTGESFPSFSSFYKSFLQLIIYFSIKLLCTIHRLFDVSAHRGNPKPPMPPPPQSQQAATVDGHWIAFSPQKCRHVGFFQHSFKYNPTVKDFYYIVTKLYFYYLVAEFF